MPKLHTVADVAVMCGVDQGKVLTWLHSGELVGINIAKSITTRPKWRIRDAAVEAFLAARSTAKPAALPARTRTKAAVGVRSFY